MSCRLPLANNILGTEISAKELILALFLLQIGSNNTLPSSSELAEESLGNLGFLASCTQLFSHFSAGFYQPLHQPMPRAAGVPWASPGLTIPMNPPFHFQPRRVGVVWHRFSAIDVEQVAWEVDVATLQEHITGITFCNLDEEWCLRCGQLADPVLLKVLRMAQLSIEYLLHCQESLGTSLAVHTQHLQAAHILLAHAQQQAEEQTVQLRGVKEESRRKQLIATHQLLQQAGPNTYCKCHLCDKAFMNNSFLQDHMQRRHAEATEEERKMKQMRQMEDEVEELKAKLQETQQQLEAEREAEKLQREQETERARQEEEGRRHLERWKEERTKLHEEIDGLRQLFLTVFKDMASRSSAMEGKLQELQAREAAESHLGTLQDDDTKEAWRWAPSWVELRGERERMAFQMKKENKTLRATASQDQRAVMDCVHQQVGALSTHLGEQPKVTKSHHWFIMRIKLFSASKPEVTQEVTKVVGDEESSDREKATPSGKQKLLEALRRNPNLLKQFRPILGEVLEEKLENVGVKRVVKGISTRTYKSLQALVRYQQQQKAEKFPSLLHLRDELVQAWGKVKRCQKPISALPRHLSVIPEAAPPTASPPRSLWSTLQTSKASSPHQGLVPRQRDSHTHNGEAFGEMPGCGGTETTQQGEILSSCELGVTQNQPAHQKTPGDSSDLETSSLEDLAGPPLVLGGPPRSPGPWGAGLPGDTWW
ncbi:LOW QUALITY PROTEIN: cilium assembly protein DZIP1L [Leptosomus discolor]